MTTEKRYEIHNIYFEQSSIVIGYIELPTDVRVDGHAILQHQLRLSAAHPDYGDDAALLHDRVTKILRNALEDFQGSEPWEPDDEPDDDDRGMGE